MERESVSPRIAAVRVQNQWQARTPRLRCVARLTRPLTAEETERLARFPEFMGAGDLVTYTCRPEEVEDWEQRLSEALELVASTRGARLRLDRSRARTAGTLRAIPR